MKNPTDLMIAKLTSAEAQKIIDMVSPTYGIAPRALEIFESIGLSLDELREWADEIRLQVFPQTATWSLPWWERRYGITPNSALTTAQRQANVLRRRLERAPMNPAKLRQIAAAAAGYPARIDFTGPFTFKIYLTAMPAQVDMSTVTAAVGSATPGHQTFSAECEQGTSAAVYAGGYIQMFKKFTIRQVVN